MENVAPSSAATFQLVLEAIKKYDSIAIVSHYNPDADAYGSSLGLGRALSLAGKKVTVYNETGVVERYAKLPELNQKLNPALKPVEKSLPLSAPFIIACDCGALKRVGDSQVAAIQSAQLVVNIDHHVSNEMFGGINLVVETASSTSEVIFELLTLGDFPIDAEVASLLMAGIIGDTGSFRYSATSARTFEIGAELVRKGAKPYQLYKDLYASPCVSAVRLQSEAISKVETFFNDGYAEIVVPEEMIVRHGAVLDDTDGLAERARDINGVKVGASIRQDGNLWRVSLRSVDEKYNVSTLAQSFGGGGHRQAAAFRISKPLAFVQKTLREKVEVLLASVPEPTS